MLVEAQNRTLQHIKKSPSFLEKYFIAILLTVITVVEFALSQDGTTSFFLWLGYGLYKIFK